MSSTILRFRQRTAAMSTVEADGRPNSGPLPDRLATFALQMRFLLGIQAIFGQDPPIHRRSTTAVRCPAFAIVHARYFPASPLPSTRNSNLSISVVSLPDFSDNRVKSITGDATPRSQAFGQVSVKGL